MPDLDAIATAIAARYAPGAVVPPAGLPNIRMATAELNVPGPLPAVLIFPDAGSLEPGNGTRIGVATFLARFYLELGVDVARDATKLRKWTTVLVDQHRTGVSLGGLVVAVRTIGWRIGALTYGEDQYAGIELRLEAVTSEPWAPTA